MAERPGTTKPVIFAVDDPRVLRAIERDLRHHACEHRDIRTAASAKAIGGTR